MGPVDVPLNSRDGGTAFEVGELLLLSAWAEFHGIRMEIALDWRAGGLEYEEVVTLRAPGPGGSRWFLWRTPGHVVLRPLLGSATRFATLSEALAAMCPEQV